MEYEDLEQMESIVEKARELKRDIRNYEQELTRLNNFKFDTFWSLKRTYSSDNDSQPGSYEINNKALPVIVRILKAYLNEKLKKLKKELKSL